MNLFVVVVQLLSHVGLFATPWLQHARLPCPSLSPGVCSNSCPLSQWWHPTISSYVAPSPLALNLSKHQGLLVSLYKGEIWTQTVKREDRVKTPGCLKASEETNPVDILILDFQPSVELWKKIHCCCLSHMVYDTYGSPDKLIHSPRVCLFLKVTIQAGRC